MANVGNITVFNNFCDSSDVMVINAGYQKRVESHSFGPFANAYHVFQYIINGKGTLRIGQQEYRLHKGTLFYLPANVMCKYYADKKDPYEYYWISFIGTRANSIVSQCGLSNHMPILTLNSSAVQEIFERTFQNIRSNKRGLSYLILSDVYALFFALTEKNENTIRPRYSTFVSNAIAYMDENFPLGINVNDVANHMYMNLSYFSELFTEETGVNPSKYLTGMRMAQAALLLKSTDLPIKEIALKIGMTPLTLTSTFKKSYSYTPKDYRKQQQKSVLND